MDGVLHPWDDTNAAHLKIAIQDDCYSLKLLFFHETGNYSYKHITVKSFFIHIYSKHLDCYLKIDPGLS